MAETVRITTLTWELFAQLASSADVDYAVIVDGRVVALGTGPLPTSSTSYLYFDLTGYDPAPSIGDYFYEVCQVFSDTPLPVPPGDIAPPWSKPRDGTNGRDGTDGEPGDSSVIPNAYTMPVLIPFHARGDDFYTIGACPNTETELEERFRTAFDLTNACGVRLQCHVDSPLVGARLILKYSLDGGATWDYVSPVGVGPKVSLSLADDRRGLFTNIADAAQGDVLLSVFVSGGDDASDVVLGNIHAMVRTKTDETGHCADLDAVCDELPTAFDLGPGGALWQDDFTDYVDDDDVRDAYPVNVVPEYWGLYGCDGAAAPALAAIAQPASSVGFTPGIGRVYDWGAGHATDVWIREVEWWRAGTNVELITISTLLNFVTFGANSYAIASAITGDDFVWQTAPDVTTIVQETIAIADYIADQLHDLVARFTLVATTLHVRLYDNGVLVLHQTTEGTVALDEDGFNKATHFSCWPADANFSQRVVLLREMYEGGDPYGLA